MSESAMNTEPCPYCLAEIPAVATRCRHCSGDLLRPVESPALSAFWSTGLVLVFFGLVLAVVIGTDGAWFGFLIAGVGGVFLQIAVISSGVSLGMRDRDDKVWAKRHSNAEAVSQ